MKHRLPNHMSMISAASGLTSACNCIGPQDGQPLCPCQMRDVQVVNGRYVRVTDLGPVREGVPAAMGKLMDKLGISEKRQREIVTSATADAKEIVARVNAEHKCPKCSTCYDKAQECDWCPKVRTQAVDPVSGRSLGPSD